MLGTEFIRSSFCHSGGCVEVRLDSTGKVEIGDTKDRSLRPHVFTESEWSAFVAGVKAGEFDYPD